MQQVLKLHFSRMGRKLILKKLITIFSTLCPPYRSGHERPAPRLLWALPFPSSGRLLGSGVGLLTDHLLLKISGWDTRNITLLPPTARKGGHNCGPAEIQPCPFGILCQREQTPLLILTKATDNIEDFSSPMAVKCIICKKKKHLRNVHFFTS